MIAYNNTRKDNTIVVNLTVLPYFNLRYFYILSLHWDRNIAVWMVNVCNSYMSCYSCVCSNFNSIGTSQMNTLLNSYAIMNYYLWVE